MTDHASPIVYGDAFHCPHCNSYSDQHWTPMGFQSGHGLEISPEFIVGCCRRCGGFTIWKAKVMIYPATGSAPLPNQDMPHEIKADYIEARDIVSKSPRSACALLRLCVEKICTDLEKSGDLNEKIKKLVAKGLDPQIQKALDSVRVIGGEAIHPLEMDLRDNTDTAQRLFKIVNYISEWAHTRPKAIDGIFDILPDSKKEAIKKRDR